MVQVPEDVAARFAAKLGIPSIETSAKNSTNVDAAFFTMVRSVLDCHACADTFSTSISDWLGLQVLHRER